MEQRKICRQLFKTNLLIKKGSKQKIESYLKKVYLLLKKRKAKNSLNLTIKSVKTIKPFYKLFFLRFRSNFLKIPIEINNKEQQILATKFFILNLKTKKNIFLHEKITIQIVETLNLTSGALKSCETFQKNVESNKVFIEYRF